MTIAQKETAKNLDLADVKTSRPAAAAALIGPPVRLISAELKSLAAVEWLRRGRLSSAVMSTKSERHSADLERPGRAVR
jgi:hypothetical protein